MNRKDKQFESAAAWVRTVGRELAWEQIEPLLDLVPFSNEQRLQLLELWVQLGQPQAA